MCIHCRYRLVANVFPEIIEQLTVNVSDLIEDSHEAFLVDVAFDHQVLSDQVHLRCCLSYSRNENETMLTIVLNNQALKRQKEAMSVLSLHGHNISLKERRHCAVESSRVQSSSASKVLCPSQ